MITRIEQSEYKSFKIWRGDDDFASANILYKNIDNKSGEIIVQLYSSGYTLSHYFNSFPEGHDIVSFIGSFCSEDYLAEKLRGNHYIYLDEICKDIKAGFREVKRKYDKSPAGIIEHMHKSSIKELLDEACADYPVSVDNNSFF